MALTDTVLNAAAAGATDVLVWAAVHSADNSAAQTSTERLEIGWDPATGGVAASGSVPLEFTGTANAAATHLGLWTAETGGTYLGAAPLSGDQTFNAAGEYAVTSVTLTATDTTAT